MNGMNRNYPVEIEEQSIALVRITERRDEARKYLEELTDIATSAVLFEIDEATGKPRYSNDKARELAIRERQRASGEYQGWAAIEREAEANRAEASARIERLRGQFAMFKREADERIADKYAAIS